MTGSRFSSVWLYSWNIALRLNSINFTRFRIINEFFCFHKANCALLHDKGSRNLSYQPSHPNDIRTRRTLQQFQFSWQQHLPTQVKRRLRGPELVLSACSGVDVQYQGLKRILSWIWNLMISLLSCCVYSWRSTAGGRGGGKSWRWMSMNGWVCSPLLSAVIIQSLSV